MTSAKYKATKCGRSKKKKKTTWGHVFCSCVSELSFKLWNFNQRGGQKSLNCMQYVDYLFNYDAYISTNWICLVEMLTENKNRSLSPIYDLLTVVVLLMSYGEIRNNGHIYLWQKYIFKSVNPFLGLKTWPSTLGYQNYSKIMFSPQCKWKTLSIWPKNQRQFT